MRFSRTASALSSLLLAFALSGAWAAEKPKRIVTLAPSLAELAADLAGDDLGRIVGVSEYTDFPAALKKVASVGPYHQFNLEKVVSLKPDLVLATGDGNPKDRVLHLRELGLNVVVVETQTLAQVESSIRELGRAMGEVERGEQMAAQLRRGIDRIRERGKARAPKRRVLLQLGDDPLIVVGHDAFLHEALEAVGAANAYADVKGRYPRPSREDAVARDPDEIVVLALGEDTKVFEAMKAAWDRFPSMKAVKTHEVKVLRADAVLRPSLRLLEGLALLEKAVYGPQSKN